MEIQLTFDKAVKTCKHLNRDIAKQDKIIKEAQATIEHKNQGKANLWINYIEQYTSNGEWLQLVDEKHKNILTFCRIREIVCRDKDIYPSLVYADTIIINKTRGKGFPLISYKSYKLKYFCWNLSTILGKVKDCVVTKDNLIETICDTFASYYPSVGENISSKLYNDTKTYTLRELFSEDLHTSITLQIYKEPKTHEVQDLEIDKEFDSSCKRLKKTSLTTRDAVQTLEEYRQMFVDIVNTTTKCVGAEYNNI